MTQPPSLGLRARKKQQMRDLIARTALELFIERGFERVTVAEVARAADVAEQTVFNHFPSKEDLVYFRLATFESDLVSAIKQRAPGETVLSAFRRHVLRPQGLLGDNDPAAGDRLAAISRMIAESPALLARERALFDDATIALAALIAGEHSWPADAIEAWTIANALVGVHRGLVGFVRAQVLAGVRGPQLQQAVEAQAERAFGILETGLAKCDS